MSVKLKVGGLCALTVFLGAGLGGGAESSPQFSWARRAGQWTALAGESANASAAHKVLLDAVASLSEPQQWLIRQLFWDGRTGAELGVALSLSQPAVSKRKQAIIRSLRDRFYNLHVAPDATAAGQNPRGF
jgi:hypothetical protein